MDARWVNADEAAKITGYSRSALAKFRVRGGGPKYAKIGRGQQAQVRYRISDLHGWMESHLRSSTSDEGSAA